MDFIKTIIKQAWGDPAKEVCGFVIQRAETMLEAFQVENIAPEPKREFQISAEDYLVAQKWGRVLAAYHSHTVDPAVPSSIDISGSQELKLPYYIFSLLDGKIIAYVPTNMERDPIIGRPYLPLIYSCMSLCHDYYTQVLKIPLPPMDMEFNEDIVMNKKIAAYVRANNFEVVSGPEIGDIIVMNTHDSKPDHTAIYYEEGTMLHHVRDRRSELTPYGGFWARATCYFLRHKSRI